MDITGDNKPKGEEAQNEGCGDPACSNCGGDKAKQLMPVIETLVNELLEEVCFGIGKNGRFADVKVDSIDRINIAGSIVTSVMESVVATAILHIENSLPEEKRIEIAQRLLSQIFPKLSLEFVSKLERMIDPAYIRHLFTGEGSVTTKELAAQLRPEQSH